jgi:hypothetical protein
VKFFVHVFKKFKIWGKISDNPVITSIPQFHQKTRKFNLSTKESVSQSSFNKTQTIHKQIFLTDETKEKLKHSIISQS